MNQPKLKNSCSMGVFNLKPSSSIVPKALKTDVGEIIVKEGKKRGNWIEMLMEIRSRWVQKQNNELDGDNEEEKGCDDGCEVDYNDDEDSVIVNLETFSGMLKHYLGGRLETMLCITICNIFMGEESTSRRYLRTGDYLSSQPEDRKAYNPYATAYEIAALAATYVQSQASRLINLDSKLRPEEDDDVILDKTYSSQRVYNSEMVVYMAATTITAVVAAPEKEKQEAAKDLQSYCIHPLVNGLFAMIRVYTLGVLSSRYVDTS
ncbi:putative phospholipase A1 PLIP1/2/3 [Helianthus debilis subsp. tardiflorus]